MTRITVSIVAIAICASGCQKPAILETDLAVASDATCIAAVGGTDRQTQEAIISLLGQNDIDCLVEGSVVYQVVVRAKDERRAIALLSQIGEISQKLLMLKGDADHPLRTSASED